MLPHLEQIVGSDSSKNTFLFHSVEIVLLPSVPLHDSIRATAESWDNSSPEVDILAFAGRSFYAGGQSLIRCRLVTLIE